MKVSKSHLFFSFLIFLLTIAGFGYYHYTKEKNNINHTFNDKLLKSCETAQILIGDEYHDKASLMPPSLNEQMEIIQNLSIMAKAWGVEYIYSMIRDENGTIRFSSSSALPHELESKTNLSFYNDPYQENQKIHQAFNTKQIVFDLDEDPDKWGVFRSVFIPYTTKKGVQYIIGADIRVSSIQKKSNIAALKAVSNALILLLGALPLLLFYRRTMKKINSKLKKDIEQATENLREMNLVLEHKVEEKTKELFQQSFEDSLTHLPNRYRLHYDIESGCFNALLILNIHNFKEVNNFFGTEAGDNILCQIGEWLQNYHSNTYRLGGDEFAFLLNNIQTASEINGIVNSLLSELSMQHFFVERESINIGMTIGIDFNPKPSLAHADIALHRAKERNQAFCFYDENEHLETKFYQNLALASSIHEALRHGRIICHYQPIVSIETGKIEKYEVLARMITEEGNIIPPLEFIKISQKIRLYPQITRNIVMQACELFQHRSEEFSINLSILDILDPSTVKFIEQTILETHTEKRIVFEILESEGIENYSEVSLFIEQMKKLGARIAIDDFGSGYSSFENILKLDVDFIKIDGSLIKNVTTDSKNALVVETITEFGKKIGAKTVAEYVATEEIFNYISNIGISYAQGYYVGKPEPL